MHPKHRGHGPLGVRLDVTVTDPGRACFTLFAIGEDGAEHRLADWSEELPDLGAADTEPLPGAEIADLLEPRIERSPTGSRVAIRVGRRAWTVDLACGDILHVDGDVDLDAVEDDFDGSPLLVWTDADVAAVRIPSSDRVVRAALAPDTAIELGGPVDDRPREASSGSGVAFVAFAPDTPSTVVEHGVAALRERVTDAIDRELRPGITLFRDGRPTVVQADVTTWRRGAERAVWPPLVGPRGLLLRRAIVRVEGEDDERVADDGPAPRSSSAYMATSTEVLAPWLVAPDGARQALPFALGNPPLATLPDGRFLLPCEQPMWWDGSNEPLTALADDGTTESLLLRERPMTPTATVRAVAPELVAEEEPTEFAGDDFDGWLITTARLRDDELRLALEPVGPTPGRPWLLVGAVLDGLRCDSLRLIATGTAPTDGVTRLIV